MTRIPTRRPLLAAVLTLAVLLSPSAPSVARPGDPGQAIKLNQPLVAGGNVVQVAVSPDSQWVVYAADAETHDRVELYSMPMAGGDPIKLNRPLGLGESVTSFDISPDSARVVYTAGLSAPLTLQLYSVPIGGGDSEPLNPPLVAGGSVSAIGSAPVSSVLITPDSSRVIYGADQETDTKVELYSVPIAGGPVTKLSPPIVPMDAGVIPCAQFVLGGFLRVGGMALTPDGTRVVFLAVADLASTVELWSAPVDQAGQAVKLNPDFAAGRTISTFGGFQISPHGATAIYIADQDIAGTQELFSVPTTGGADTKLHPNQPAGRTVGYASFAGSTGRVVYSADHDTGGQDEVYSVAATGGPVTKLSLPLPSGGSAVLPFAPATAAASRTSPTWRSTTCATSTACPSPAGRPPSSAHKSSTAKDSSYPWSAQMATR